MVSVARQDGRLPLAAARNAGARCAARAGAEVLVFLDVDCIPSAELVERYATRRRLAGRRRAAYAGAVHYLPPQARRPRGTTDPRTSRSPRRTPPAPA